MKTCRICPLPADTLTVYELEPWPTTDRPRVEHPTCSKHTAPLREDMEDAGWTVAGPVLRLVPLLPIIAGHPA